MEALAWPIAIGICAVALVFDLFSRRIPNWLTAPMFLAALMWAGSTTGLQGLGDALAASILVSLPFIILFSLCLGGAGDAKLMAAVGAWLGLNDGLTVLALVVASGGVIGLGYALVVRKFSKVLSNLQMMIFNVGVLATHRPSWSLLVGSCPKSEQMLRMPYALAILAGVCLAAAGVRLW